MPLSASRTLPNFRRILLARCPSEGMQATACPPAIGQLDGRADRECYDEGQRGGRSTITDESAFVSFLRMYD
jgi:hypothetical protein